MGKLTIGQDGWILRGAEGHGGGGSKVEVAGRQRYWVIDNVTRVSMANK